MVIFSVTGEIRNVIVDHTGRKAVQIGQVDHQPHIGVLCGCDRNPSNSTLS